MFDNLFFSFSELAGFFLFGLGALLGSFANVVILRLPRGESVVSPRSHCPSCKKTVSWYDNIPIVSYFVLRAKCRACGARISWRYPLVEFLMACAFLFLYLQEGWTFTLLEHLFFAFGLITAAFIDIDHMILPDVFTLSGVVLGLAGGLLSPERSAWSALAGVLMGGGFLWLVAYLYFIWRKTDGMGGGDIKLLAWIGAVLGWQAVPFVILTSSLIGSCVGVVLALRSREGLKVAIPFGPYLVAAAFFYIFGGRDLALSYLQLFFPWMA